MIKKVQDWGNASEPHPAFDLFQGISRNAIQYNIVVF